MELGQKFSEDSGPRMWGLLDKIKAFILLSVPIAGVFYVTKVFVYVGMKVHLGQYLAFVLFSVLFLVFLTKRASGRPSQKVPWYDVLWAIACLVVGMVIIVRFEPMILAPLILTTEKIILGAFTMVSILEGIRRTAGPVLFFVLLLFFFYALFAQWFPPPFHSLPTKWDTLIVGIFLIPTGLFSTLFWIVATIALSFLLFGQLFQRFGGGELLTDLAFRAFGQTRGGAAKIAIVASAIFGGLSGSAAANVYVTGVITIPMMKKTGFSNNFAGAVEAGASTGGVVTPPVMGPVAFLMAEVVGVGYYTIAKVALIPALLYYWSMFSQVDGRALKRGLRGVRPDEIVKLSTKQIWRLLPLVVVPFFVLVFFLFIFRWGADISAMLGVFTILAVGLLVWGEGKLRLVIDSLKATTVAMREIGMVAAGGAIILTLLSVTGQGQTIAYALVDMAGGNLGLLMLLTALVSIILGCGMPVLGVYTVLAILVAPAMEAVGVPTIVAHLYVLYFGVMSFVTPPVAVAAYAAASLSGGSGFKTGLEAMKLGFPAYVVPVLFVLNPGILLMGSLFDIAVGVISAFIGISLLCGAIQGAFWGKLLSPIQRVVATIIGGLIMWPHWQTQLVGIALLLAAFVIFTQVLSRRARNQGTGATH